MVISCRDKQNRTKSFRKPLHLSNNICASKSIYMYIYGYMCVYLCIYTHMCEYRYACICTYLYTCRYIQIYLYNGQPFTDIKSVIPSWDSNWNVNPSCLPKSSDCTGTLAASSKSSKLLKIPLTGTAHTHRFFHSSAFFLVRISPSIPTVLVHSHRWCFFTSTASFLSYSFKPFPPRSCRPWQQMGSPDHT